MKDLDECGVADMMLRFINPHAHRKTNIEGPVTKGEYLLQVDQTILRTNVGVEFY